MKIGYFLRTFPQLSETFVINEIALMEKSGHNVTLAAIFRPGGNIINDLKTYEKRTLYWFDIDKSRLFSILCSNIHLFLSFPQKYMRLFFQYTNKKQFVKFLKSVCLADYFYSSGVSHMHTHFAWEQVDYLRFIKELTGIPYSLTMHAADIYSEIYKLNEAVNESVFAVTISDFNRKYLISNYNISPEKLKVVHCGVDIQAFSFEPTAANQTPVILSIGRMTEKKGFDILLNALKIIKDRGIFFQAKLIGEGSLMPELIQMKERLGLSGCVEFMGALNHADVLTELFKCDLFALPCRQAESGDIDGIPVVLMEAMASGKPVVSTRLSGIPELVIDGCGVLADPEDRDGMADAIEKIIKNQASARQMGLNARLQVEKSFSIQSQVDGLMKLIRSFNESGKNGTEL